MSPQPNWVANAITNPPTAFPQIAVGGHPYETRFTLASSFFLEEKCDIPAQELAAWMDSHVAKKHISSMFMTITAAMLGHQKDGDWIPTPMLPSEFAAKCTPDEWAKVMGIYTEAMSKVAAAVNKILDQAKTPPPPPQTPEPQAQSN